MHRVVHVGQEVGREGRSLHRHAAVADEYLPGDVASLIRGEEEGAVSDIFRLTEVTQGDAGEHGFLRLFGDGISHVSGDEAGGDGVDGHLAAGDFLSHGFSEADDACLGGGVVGLAEVAGHADDGAQVDDAAGGALHQCALQGFDKEEYALEVGGDDSIPIALFHAHQQTILGDTGVVDQDIDGGVSMGCLSYL